MLNDELLHKWVNGSLNAEELEIFKARPEYDSLVALYKNTENLTPSSFDEDSMLAEILQQKKPDAIEVDLGKRRVLSTWVKYIAATAAFLIGAWFLWPKNQLVSFELAAGEVKEGVLPDQSMFTLNESSTLSYDEGKWQTDRTLELKGEAFFSVKPGSKFTVKTSNGSVQVLGTQFNVWSRDGILEVKCQSGKVAILSQTGKVLDELNPKDAIRVAGNKAVDKWQLQSGRNANWGAKISTFKNAKLLTVIKDIERQYGVEIDINGMNIDELITCKFQYEDLDLALTACLKPMGIGYVKEGERKIKLVKE